MATNVTDKVQTTTPAIETNTRTVKLFTLIALAAIIVGAGSMLGGLAGGIYTYQSAAVENINTPGDAVIADTAVRGPLTMWAQSEVITRHQLDRTDGLRYAEMDRLVPQTDPDTGEIILDDAGEPVMVNNEVRLSWIDATALTTVLGMGIMAYALSAFAFVIGALLIGLGWVVLKLRSSSAVLN
ncbi:MAG: hypothetical protein JJT89_15570 [Nitriliruptoraceae bacterium]|nr:hypothetical protein [Nitriliruptoraceae bacterium]